MVWGGRWGEYLGGKRRVCVSMADSCWCLTEKWQNSEKQLSFN